MGRRAVATTPINRTLVNELAVIPGAGSKVCYIENASTTDGFYGDLSLIVPPGGVGFDQFKSTSGNLINVAIKFITPGEIIELYIDEGIDGANGWMRSDTQLVYPFIPQFTRAFRFVCPLLRITMANGGAGLVFAYIMIRTSTS